MGCASDAASRDEDRRRGWYRRRRSWGSEALERIGAAIGVKVPAIVIIPAIPTKAWVRFADSGARVSMASFAMDGPSRREAGGHRSYGAFDSTARSGSSGVTGIIRIWPAPLPHLRWDVRGPEWRSCRWGRGRPVGNGKYYWWRVQWRR